MKRYSLPCLLAMLVFGIISCTEGPLTETNSTGDAGSALNKHKPGHGGGGPGGGDGGPEPTGTVFFYADDDYPAVSGSNYDSDPNGNNRTDTFVLDKPAVPSNNLHGGAYWFATVRPAAGTYPDGRPRQEIFLEKEGGAVSVQFTDEFDLEVNTTVAEGLTWLPGDTAVAFQGRRITDDPCTEPDCPVVIEEGTYALSVVFDGGAPAPPPAATAFLAVSKADYEYQVVWSPDATRIAFPKDGELLVGDIVAGQLDASSTAVLTQGFPMSWSVQGEILFCTSSCDLLHRIGDDGSGQTQLAAVGNDQSAGNGRWSPDGNHLVYRELTYRWRGNRGSVSADVIRVDRNGNNRKNLTRDFEYSEPTGWR